MRQMRTWARARSVCSLPIHTDGSTRCTTRPGIRREPTKTTVLLIGPRSPQNSSQAGAILVFGDGKGKANASHHWVTYVEKHHRDVAAKLVADVRIDVDHLDERQVLRLAQIYFGEAPERDVGDNRRGGSER